MPSLKRAVFTWVILYAVLPAFSSLNAYTTRQYVKLGSFEEASRAIAAAGNDEQSQDLSELVESIHQQVNDFRRAQGRQPLRLNPIISAQARQHSAQMARKGSAVTHVGFEDRLKRIGEQLPYRAGAENVAASIGYENPARTAVVGWKTSPGHRKNMLGDFTLTGIGIAQSGQGSYFITQIFLKASQ
ncbi:MAG TPA: CAP domain-containing protein [Candidatus Binatia bacterium]